MAEEGDSEPKRVVCLNCGHVWETTAKRPQCSICKSTRVEEVDSADVDQHVDESESTESTKDVDDFFELDDSAINELIKEDKPKKKKGRKKKGQKAEDKAENGEKKGFSIRGGLKAVGSKLSTGVILIGVGILFLFFILRGIAARKSRKIVRDMGMDIQEEEQGFDPYSALG
ncbi:MULTISPECIES: hypothetical protein [unclassified Archaeoglobus]|uniref:hypothetical protein n=1 Tax=unclassified Archaeoglobus TaxID=2643606 RepID=UPI0025BFA77F|nr:MULTISPECIES: hypothetical protein [unclassified Archaeoglobus]